MKRDLDLIRTLLLKLESMELPVHEGEVISASDDKLAVEGRSENEIGHHLVWIAEAGLITGEVVSSHNAILFERLSWQGCDFLDAVRDPEVWKRTKDGASKMGGWTFGLLKDLGTAYLKHAAKERLGLDL